MRFLCGLDCLIRRIQVSCNVETNREITCMRVRRTMHVLYFLLCAFMSLLRHTPACAIIDA